MKSTIKSTRHELKALIKECLVEILAEGLGGNLVESVKRSVPLNEQPLVRRQSPPRFDPVLDRRVQPRETTGALQDAIRAEAKGNPVMADIFADTAATTLQQQIQAEGRAGGGDAVSMAIANVAPEEIFGEEVASKWAELAFATPIRHPAS